MKACDLVTRWKVWGVMAVTRDHDRIPAPVVVVAAAALVALALGVVGFAIQRPELHLLDWVYKAAQLFLLNVELDSPPLVLEIARYLALAVAGYTLFSLVLRVLSRQVSLLETRRRRGHVVFVGDGPEIAKLAAHRSYRKAHARVAVVGELSEVDVAELASLGVPSYPALSDKMLAGVLVGAAEITVIGKDDAGTAGLADRVRAACPDVMPRALFDSPDLTRQWSLGEQRILTPVCRVTQVAIELLRKCPPFPPECAVPDPVIIGDGELGEELVRRIIVGWQRDGWRPRVNCLTATKGWTEDLTELFGQDVIQVTRRAKIGHECATRLAKEVQDNWRGPEEGRGVPGGVRVYVALSDDPTAVTIATALLAAVPGCQVGVIVEDTQPWTGIFAGQEDRAQLVSRVSLLADPDVLTRSEAGLLRDELLVDAATWPEDSPTLFDTPERLNMGMERLVANEGAEAIRVLAAAGVEVGTGGVPTAAPGLSPSNLIAMRAVLLDVLADIVPDDVAENDLQMWALEFANRLPSLMQRCGWILSSGDASIYDESALEEMALRVHASYSSTAKELGNPTNSPVAEQEWEEMSDYMKAGNRAVVTDYPVKLAAFGLEWRRAKKPVPYELSIAQVELLAIAEHRRWAHHQRRNGRINHPLLVPWDKLSDSQRRLDTNNADKMVAILGSQGIEVYDPHEATQESR